MTEGADRVARAGDRAALELRLADLVAQRPPGLQDGEVEEGIDVDPLRRGEAAQAERDLDPRGRVAGDMGIRHDPAARLVDHEARAGRDALVVLDEAELDARPHLDRVVEGPLEDALGVVGDGVACGEKERHAQDDYGSWHRDSPGGGCS
jgi:hypothetical protein